jgi:hypothetical protein
MNWRLIFASLLLARVSGRDGLYSILRSKRTIVPGNIIEMERTHERSFSWSGKGPYAEEAHIILH